MISSEKLLVGAGTLDDAGVYQLDESTGLVLTVDLFPPVVDDPLHYGRIAAANSLSDVYAMGGTPLAALNIFTYPFEEISSDIAAEILRGGLEKIGEAGAVLAGGHTMRDTEIKYGLAVIGRVSPDEIVANAGARPGDVLFLTKPLGIGIITTAQKKDLIDESNQSWLEGAIEVMETLNRVGGEVMAQVGVHGATDITGFGLVGHALEMATASEVTLEIDGSALPLLPGTMELLNQGCLSGGSVKNRATLEGDTHFLTPPSSRYDVACDAQTSGGLLIAVAREKAEDLSQKLQAQGLYHHPIGRVLDEVQDSPIHWKE